MNLPNANKKPAGGESQPVIKSKLNKQIIDDFEQVIKSALLSGASVRLTDFAEDQRQAAQGIISKLRDEYPITCRWQTVSESHISQTRLRASSYRIDGEFLHGIGG